MKTKIKLTAALISLLCMTHINIFAAGKLPKEASDSKISIYINDIEQNIPEDYGRAYFDKSTNRVMVPVRYISENLGAKINFYNKINENKRGILIGSVDGLIELDINSNKAKVLDGDNAEFKELDAPAILYDGRTYVPIRFISETMGMKVDWKNNTVYIKGTLAGGKKQREKNKDKKNNNTDTVNDLNILEEKKDSISNRDNILPNKSSSKNDIKTKGSLFNYE